MFPFWKMTKSQSKFPSMRIASISQLDGISLVPKCFNKFTSKPESGSLELLGLIFLNHIISTFIQADTLNITYSITLLLLRSWEGRRLTDWSPGQNHALWVKKGTTQIWAHFLILWYLLAYMTPRKWKVSRKNTEKMHSPSHMASMSSVVNVV